MEVKPFDSMMDSELIDAAESNDDHLLKALKNKRTKAIIKHRPGAIITQPSGTKHKVWEDGSWRRLLKGVTPDGRGNP